MVVCPRDQCEKLAKKINDFIAEDSAEECSVAYYHAGLSQCDRARTQQHWQDGVISLMCKSISCVYVVI